MTYRILIAAAALMCVPMAVADDKTEWELWLPPSGKAVTAVFVAPRWGDGATMVNLVQKELGEELGIATLLSREDKLTFKEPHFLPSIPGTLSDAAVKLKHPELANAPLLLWSHSNSAAYIQQALDKFPERIIAYCLFKSAFGHNNDLGTGDALKTLPYGYKSPDPDPVKPGTLSQAAREVFGTSIWDMNDRIKSPGYDQEHERKVMMNHMAAARKQGALVHVTLVRGTHHMIDGQQPLMMAYFRTAMRMRLPANANPAKGPVKLVSGLEKKGMYYFESSKTMYDFSNYPKASNPREAWWLPSRDYAVMWNAYALNAKGTLAEPGSRGK